MSRIDIRSSRPLRFLLIILLCWTSGRLVMTTNWPAFGEPLVASTIVPLRRTAVRSATKAPHPTVALATMPPVRSAIATPSTPAAAPRRARPTTDSVVFLLRDEGFVIRPAPLQESAPIGSALTPAIPTATPILMPGPASADRWRGSAWLLWRANGNGGTLAGAGQLGGSQAGFRIDRDLTPKSGARLAAYARLTAALDRPHAPEAATGIALQPSRKVPVSIAIERRIALGTGARNAFAFMAAGGIGPIDIAQGLKLEGYGQAGMVGLRHRDAFADGRISLLHPLGRSPLSAGVSVSGGAQPHIARLDIGPAIEARLPIGGQPTRLIAEWRERVAGTARPGSGFALTLAADF